MNLAVFLHQHKEFKDSTLPLPLAPLYTLPRQNWYFSSSTLIPLKKRQQNLSFFNYVKESDALSQTAVEAQNKVKQQFKNKQFLCVYEKNNYLEDTMKRIFQTIHNEIKNGRSSKQKIKRFSQDQALSQAPKSFIADRQSIKECLQKAKKQFKNQKPQKKQQQYNWHEFSKLLISQHLGINLQNISQQQLNIYKLPQKKDKTSEHQIFSILWSNNYVVFKNEAQISVNQHMKSKVLQLCELIASKLSGYFQTQMHKFIGEVCSDIENHNQYVNNFRNAIQIGSFKVWFYKKQANNEIYALYLSHVTLKGIQYCIFPHFQLQKSLSQNQNLQNRQKIQQMQKVYHQIQHKHTLIQNRLKSQSQQASQKTLKTLHISNPKLRLKRIASNFLTVNKTCIAQQNKILKAQCQLSETQCACCSNLLATKDIVNQITAKNIDPIRYLRQIKIRKIDLSPYQFVNICPQCYKVYLKSYKQKQSRQSSNKKNQRLNENKSKKRLEKDKSISDRNAQQQYVFINKMTKRRADSTRSIKKLKKDFETCIQSKGINESHTCENDRILNAMKLRAASAKYRKHNTTYTTNTQVTINRQDSLYKNSNNHQMHIEQRDEGLESSPNIKQKNINQGHRPCYQRTKNILNRLVQKRVETQQMSDSVSQDYFKTQYEPNLFVEAIRQYERIDRRSFKRIVHKNYKNYLFKGYNNQTQKIDEQQIGKKKSVWSYLENN